MDTAPCTPTLVVEIENLDTWSPDLDAVAPQSICVRWETPAR